MRSSIFLIPVYLSGDLTITTTRLLLRMPAWSYSSLRLQIPEVTKWTNCQPLVFVLYEIDRYRLISHCLAHVIGSVSRPSKQNVAHFTVLVAAASEAASFQICIIQRFTPDGVNKASPWKFLLSQPISVAGIFHVRRWAELLNEMV